MSKKFNRIYARGSQKFSANLYLNLLANIVETYAEAFDLSLEEALIANFVETYAKIFDLSIDKSLDEIIEDLIKIKEFRNE